MRSPSSSRTSRSVVCVAGMLRSEIQSPAIPGSTLPGGMISSEVLLSVYGMGSDYSGTHHACQLANSAF